MIDPAKNLGLLCFILIGFTIYYLTALIYILCLMQQYINALNKKILNHLKSRAWLLVKALKTFRQNIVAPNLFPFLFCLMNQLTKSLESNNTKRINQVSFLFVYFVCVCTHTYTHTHSLTLFRWYSPRLVF